MLILFARTAKNNVNGYCTKVYECDNNSQYEKKEEGKND